MNSDLLEPSELNVDLAFSSISEINSDEISKDVCNQFRLLDSEFWSTQLKVWIQYISNDTTSICPDLVRQINSFSIGLQFTDDRTIAQLNKEWLDKATKTDVLSFPVFDPRMVHPGNKHAELGDIIVSIPTAQKQALEHNHHLSIELLWLVSHGLLHLLGWDHQEEKTLRKMLRFQEQLLGISVNLPTEGIEAEQPL
tara:strand:+ start:34736 stop:35326 length:591 start_codon:yes stop_codon:yes gene_type:complete